MRKLTPVCVRACAVNMEDPRIQMIYERRRLPLKLIVNKAFFETGGWTADQNKYVGVFNPTKDWKVKSKGEIYVLFDGDLNRMKCSLAALLVHGFDVEGDDESSSEVSDGDSSDSDVPVGALAAKTKRKAAAAAEKKLEATDGNETQVFS